MSLDEITVTITGFIKDELLEEKGVVLSPASELIDSALLNSMRVIRLLAFLQDHYQIEDISNNDMHLENFRTISTIADLVGRYTNVNRAATPEMIFVPGGAFTMGDVWGDGLTDELPVFACEVSDFYFGRYPITNEEFVIFLNDIGKNVDDDGNMMLDLRSGDPASTIAFADGAYRHGQKAGRHPVRYLSWHGATNYCRWLSSRLGCGVRLPTELEWQYAACGGKNLKWGLGNRFDKDKYVISQHEGPSPVDFGEESEYGLKCITGNIFEWCEDEYRFSFNPHDNPVLKHHRVMKGGAFSLNDITNFRNSKRFSCFEKSCLNCIGLRILSQQELPPHFALRKSAK